MKALEKAIEDMYKIDPKLNTYLTDKPTVPGMDNDCYNWIIEIRAKSKLNQSNEKY